MVGGQEVSDYIHHLIQLTEQEQQIEHDQLASVLTSSDFAQLQQKGLAAGPLTTGKTSIGLGGRTLLPLSRPGWVDQGDAEGGERWEHGFRAGDEIELMEWEKGESKGKVVKGKGKEKNSVEGVVWKVLQQKIVIALARKDIKVASEDAPPPEVELPGLVKLLKTSNPATTSRQIATLRLLHRLVLKPLPPSSSNEPKSSTPPPELSPEIPPLISVLLGLASPSPSRFLTPETDVKHLEFYDPNLNESQRAAITFCLHEAGEVGLIWGPPGTGKTQTLLELIRHFVSPPYAYRILICGSSNLSVDNLLSRLLIPLPSPTPTSPRPSPILATRLGNPSRALASLSSHTLESQSLRTEGNQLLEDVRSELEELERELVWKPKGKGGVRGSERRKKWDEVRELRREFRKREGKGVGEVLSKANVVVGTTHSAGSKLLENEVFDVVIVDEAAQCVEPSAWIPILKLKRATGRLILAGDDLQLPPTVLAGKEDWSDKKATNGKKESKPKKGGRKDSEAGEPSEEAVVEKKLDELRLDDDDQTSSISTPSPPETSPASDPSTPSPLPTLLQLPLPKSLSTTLFTRLLSLHGPSIRRMLKVQYRFNTKINDFPSKTLYDAELVPHESVARRKLSELRKSLGEKGSVEIEEGDELDEEVIFYDTAGAAMYEKRGEGDPASASKSNENEATIVVSHIEALIEAKLPPSKIAIISPYNAQVSLLSSLLHPRYPELEIGSVDGFQGREQEVVIISLVRSNAKGEVGFLKDDRRLNVAMTRARSQLVIVGDSQTVSKGGKFLKDWMEWLEENADVRLAVGM